ncbi:MAG: hypothetical protein JWM19_6056 [Actinomycetia bacterium]|nr:hypothetical protein [Actinomycetes bacterium]
MPESASLEIHEINVGQGDSVLIINRNLTQLQTAIQNEVNRRANTPGQLPTPPDNPIDLMPYAIAHQVPLAGTVVQALLVDGGDDAYGSDVVHYLEAHGALVPGTVWTPNLSVLVSHYHDDHMAGLRSVFKEAVKDANGKVSLVERYRPGKIYQAATAKGTDPKALRFQWFQGDIADAISASPNPSQRFYVDPGGLIKNKPAVISLGKGAGNIPIDAYIVASAQGVYNAATGKVVRIKSVTNEVDQNDRSIALVVEYGSFRYFLGGDIAGNGGPKGGNTGRNAADQQKKKYYSVHADVETDLGRALEARFPATAPADRLPNKPKYPNDGYCTVMKADHHGSSSSVDVYFLATIRPVVMLISSGIKSRFHRHPTQQVMYRATDDEWAVRPVKGQPARPAVDNTIAQIYITEVAQKVKKKAFTVDIGSAAIVGDIVLRPVDETVTAIQQDTQPRQLSFQVYGTRVQSDLADKVDTELRPVEDPGAPGDFYPSSPANYSDLH